MEKQKRSRILIVCNSYPPEIGGAPSRIAHLAALLRDSGYHVTVITAVPNYPHGAIMPGWGGRLIQSSTEEGIRVRRYFFFPSNSTSLFARGASLLSWMLSVAFLAGPRIIFSRRALTIISTPPLPGAAAAAFCAALGRKKVLLNVSDLWPSTGVEMGLVRKGFLVRALQGIERRLYRRARAITVQSDEIGAHVLAHLERPVPLFLYRNLPAGPADQKPVKPAATGRRKILYAGLLGAAQDLLGICSRIDFKTAGTELHIYGGGLQHAALASFLGGADARGIIIHPALNATEMAQTMAEFDAALIPLAMPIRGAVPSKMFSALAAGLPLFFSAGGEGAALTERNRLGWTSSPGDYDALTKNLCMFAALSDEELRAAKEHVLKMSAELFNREKQDAAFLHFIRQL